MAAKSARPATEENSPFFPNAKMALAACPEAFVTPFVGADVYPPRRFQVVMGMY